MYYQKNVNVNIPGKAQRQIQKIARKLKGIFEDPVRVKNLQVFYRMSDGGYDKIKPPYIGNEACLSNFISHFGQKNFHLIADNVNNSTWQQTQELYPLISSSRTTFGNGAASFNLALDLALKQTSCDMVYFVEDDYIHRLGAYDALIEGIELGADYVTLYDHPDKYYDGGNPLIEGNGEITKVYLTKSCHWKLTNSTTMTFAATVKTLRKDELVLRKWTNSKHPHDFDMFMELRDMGRSLISPIPGYSTHGETKWLCPLVDWEATAKEE